MMRAKLFLAGYILCHLDAFVLAGVPLPWIGLLLIVVTAATDRLMPFHGLNIAYAMLLATLCASTVLNGLDVVPASHVAARLVNLVAFFMIVNYVALKSRSAPFALRFERQLLQIGVAVAALALGIFVMHVLGLGDLPRNRIGTDGLVQPILFTAEVGDPFSRALGTFREPSFLAMALVLPAMMAWRHRQWSSLGVIGVALYFSYSLGLLVALPLGLLLTMLLLLDLPRLVVGVVGAAVAVAALVALLLLAATDSPLADRLVHVASLDLLETSRGYVYENLDLLGGSLLFGGGIGRFGYSLAALMGSDFPISSLNLFIAVFASGGVLALALVLVWFIAPNLLLRQARRRVGTREALLLLVPANVFVFLYLSTFEELHVWHAIAMGLCLGRVARRDSSRRTTKRHPAAVTPAAG